MPDEIPQPSAPSPPCTTCTTWVLGVLVVLLLIANVVKAGILSHRGVSLSRLRVLGIQMGRSVGTRWQRGIECMHVGHERISRAEYASGLPDLMGRIRQVFRERLGDGQISRQRAGHLAEEMEPSQGADVAERMAPITNGFGHSAPTNKATKKVRPVLPLATYHYVSAAES